MEWLIHGDCHGNFNWLNNFKDYEQEKTGFIILGDAGFNFYLNKSDDRLKQYVESFNFPIYCVRGNHEQRPELIHNMHCIFDLRVKNRVYYQPQYPHIHYLIDGYDYTFNDHKALVLGGAYSVDKWFRLAGEDPNTTHWTGWFKYEQLTDLEKDVILTKIVGKSYDFILSHTCPIQWEPSDLFLNGVDQSKVDKSMEEWLGALVDQNIFNWFVWLFGHYHADRIEQPHVEQFFTDTENLEDIYQRWRAFDRDPETLEWWIVKSPKFGEWQYDTDQYV